MNDDSKKKLIKYIDQMNRDEELKKMSQSEIKKQIQEEWEELINSGTEIDEVVSVVLDGCYKWMSIQSQNKVFVYKTLIELCEDKSHEMVSYLKNEMNTNNE